MNFEHFWKKIDYSPEISIRVVFIRICPRHCERNSCHNVKTFLLSSGFPAQIVTHIWRAKAKICSTFAFEFFLKFWTFVESIQSSFLFSFQKYKFFWNRTKIDVFTMFFPWNYFLCGRIPSFLENGKQNVKVLWEEFRCHLILWVTMWAEFFSHCDSHCEKIVRKLWVEMNTLIMAIWPNFNQREGWFIWKSILLWIFTTNITSISLIFNCLGPFLFFSILFRTIL